VRLPHSTGGSVTVTGTCGRALSGKRAPGGESRSSSRSHRVRLPRFRRYGESRDGKSVESEDRGDDDGLLDEETCIAGSRVEVCPCFEEEWTRTEGKCLSDRRDYFVEN
jgi:hypothetical protein